MERHPTALAWPPGLLIAASCVLAAGIARLFWISADHTSSFPRFFALAAASFGFGALSVALLALALVVVVATVRSESPSRRPT
jgi:hypothetical protein